MKTYTLIEALQEIQDNLPFYANNITKIEYEDGTKFKFVIQYKSEKMYFINLNANTYILLKSI